MYAFFGVLVGFKIVTLILIYVVAASWSTIGFFLASHVLWIAVGAIVIWAPALFWTRLVRVRAKRKQLLQEEWRVDEKHRTRTR